MRRFRQLLPKDMTEDILKKGSNGVLSLIDQDGEPYGVPISYVYDGGNKIYFHSATSGYKIDCIEACNYCSFCVVDRDMVVPEEFTTYFRSAIAKGSIRKIRDSKEIHNALLMLCEKYSPGIESTNEIAKCMSHVMILCLDITELTGKEAIELVRARQNNP